MQNNMIDDFISYEENENYARFDHKIEFDSDFFCKQEDTYEIYTENPNPAFINEDFANMSMRMKEEYIPSTSYSESIRPLEETKINIEDSNSFGMFNNPERNVFNVPAHSTQFNQSQGYLQPFDTYASAAHPTDIPKRRAESKMRYNQNPKRVHVKSPKQAKDLESYDPDLSLTETPTQSDFSEAMNDRRKASSRLSASKRYPQQVIVGFGRHIVRKHEKLNGEFDKQLVNFVKENILGKSDQTYKISSIKDIRRIFQRVPVKDSPRVVEVKEFLFDKFKQFFKDGSYFIWLKTDYRGEILNKVWLAINKKSIEERFFEDKCPGFNSVARDVPDLEQKFYQMLDHKLETIEAKA